MSDSDEQDDSLYNENFPRKMTEETYDLNFSNHLQVFRGPDYQVFRVTKDEKEYTIKRHNLYSHNKEPFVHINEYVIAKELSTLNNNRDIVDKNLLLECNLYTVCVYDHFLVEFAALRFDTNKNGEMYRDTYCILMEYIPKSRTFFDLFSCFNALSISEKYTSAVKFMTYFFTALSKISSLDILIGNITPASIIFNQDLAKISFIELGGSCIIPTTTRYSKTAVEDIDCMPRINILFTAPEIILDRIDYETDSLDNIKSVDIFSLGSIFFTLLNGFTPLGLDYQEITNDEIEEYEENPSKLPTTIKKSSTGILKLDELLNGCVSYLPENRYRVGTILEKLKEL